MKLALPHEAAASLCQSAGLYVTGYGSEGIYLGKKLGAAGNAITRKPMESRISDVNR
jgi:hypothetical protein